LQFLFAKRLLFFGGRGRDLTRNDLHPAAAAFTRLATNAYDIHIQITSAGEQALFATALAPAPYRFEINQEQIRISRSANTIIIGAEAAFTFYSGFSGNGSKS